MAKQIKQLLNTKQIGKKTYVIDNRVWVCMRCKGSGNIEMISNAGIETLTCPCCKGGKNG